MKPTDKIKELINKSDVWTGPETERRVLSDALKYLGKLKQQKSAGLQLNIWRIITRGWGGKAAVAAAIFVAFGIGFSMGRWSKPARLAPPSVDVTGYTSAVSTHPTAPKTEDSFWRQKVLAAMQPRPYTKSRFDRAEFLKAYKQYLKEKHYE